MNEDERNAVLLVFAILITASYPRAVLQIMFLCFSFPLACPQVAVD